MLNEPFVDFFSVLLNARSEISIEFQLLGHTYVTYFLRITYLLEYGFEYVNKRIKSNMQYPIFLKLSQR